MEHIGHLAYGFEHLGQSLLSRIAFESTLKPVESTDNSNGHLFSLPLECEPVGTPILRIDSRSSIPFTSSEDTQWLTFPRVVPNVSA